MAVSTSFSRDNWCSNWVTTWVNNNNTELTLAKSSLLSELIFISDRQTKKYVEVLNNDNPYKTLLFLTCIWPLACALVWSPGAWSAAMWCRQATGPLQSWPQPGHWHWWPEKRAEHESESKSTATAAFFRFAATMVASSIFSVVSSLLWRLTPPPLSRCNNGGEVCSKFSFKLPSLL